MNENSGPKKRDNLLRAFNLGILIPSIGGNFIVLLMAFGALTFWKPFAGPPSGVAQIITIRWDLMGKVWVKARDGTYYSTNLMCHGSGSTDAATVCDPQRSYHHWEPVTDISQIPDANILRGRNCTSLKKGIFPFNPLGSISECFYTFRKGDAGGDLYLALLVDGSLKYWENLEYIPFYIVLGFLCIAFSFYVSVIIYVIYLIVYLVQRIRRKKLGTQPAPG